ncbi:toll-like receptor 8 [Narcine bancroftii]|uniref:toll-like receptor 8 n=1 Tax=Narcine bancroftii TaxID=1343680 RepID=UPI00383198CD
MLTGASNKFSGMAKRTLSPALSLLLLNVIARLLTANWVPRDLPCDVMVENNGSSIRMDCKDRRLRRVPGNIPSNTTSLNLAHNQIMNISNDSFSKLQNLTQLDLGFNYATGSTALSPDSERMTISEGSFSFLMKLRDLFLDESHLLQIPKDLPSSLRFLSLSGNNILNITNKTLLNLSNIEILNLSRMCYHFNPCNVNNRVEDNAFATCKKLKILSLDSNNLTSVPRYLPTSLRSLSLSCNKIQTINDYDFSHLIGLEFLDLSENCPRCYNAAYPCEPCPGDASIQIHPNAFQNLAKLKKLYLSSNCLRKIQSSWFQNCTNLKVLYLRFNFLVSELSTGEFLNYLPKLEELDISYNYEIKAYPKCINLSDNFAKLVSLTQLHIEGYVFKELNDLDLKPLYNLHNLTVLNFGTNFIKQADLKIFNQLKSLRLIYLSENRISPPSNKGDLFFGSIHESQHFLHAESSLKNSDLLLENGNQVYESFHDHDQGPTLKWPCRLYGKTLDLSSNSIFFINPEQFKGFEDVRCLNLSANAIGQALNGTEFKTLPNLRYLDLSYNRLDPAYDYAFKELTQLEVLDLSYNKHYFIVEGVTHKMRFIENLKYLKVLNLSDNAIFTLTGSGLNSDSIEVLEFKGNRLDILWKNKDHRYISLFKNLTNLTYLDLSYNHLQAIPQDVYENLPCNLTNLSFSHNLLKEFKWTKLHLLKRLLTLDLSSNKLTTAPDKLYNYTKSLENLLLGNNRISELPISFLTTSNRLKYLDLSNNKIKVFNHLIFPTSEKLFLEVLILKGNPFYCTCELAPFIAWINACDLDIPKLATDVTCHSPEDHNGQSIIHLDQRTCRMEEVEASLCLSSAIIIICIMVISIIHHLFYWDAWHFYYFCTSRLKGNRYHSLTIQNSSYDAFIAYDTSNLAVTDWVINELLIHLEDRGERQFSLCLEERDWSLGMAIVDNLSQSIHGSKKTVFILTKSYAKRGSFQIAFQMAHQRLLDENEDVIVLILLEPDLINSKYLRLRRRLCSSSVLQWPKNPKSEGFFWQCLRNVIATNNRLRYNAITEFT